MNWPSNQLYLWKRRVRDPAFTTMLVLQVLIIFSTPLATMGLERLRETLQLLLLVFTLLVCLISRGPIAATLAISAFIADSVGYVLDLVAPSNISLMLGYTGSLGAFILASYALADAVLAPGRVTAHRVRGAIALYLNIGLMFGAIYRLIWFFIPDSLSNIPSGTSWPAGGTILYFSFVTLTSTGFGDVVPVHPLVRTLANVEAIIGQLYPATLLARLITLELRGHRRAILVGHRRGSRSPRVDG